MCGHIPKATAEIHILYARRWAVYAFDDLHVSMKMHIGVRWDTQ